MVTHVFTAIMATLKHTFLVTIEIDSKEAMPCNCGHRCKTHPDWQWKYANREQNFINDIWHEFRSCFDYDGLACRIVEIGTKQFAGFFVPSNDDKLFDAEYLIQEVYDDVFPNIADPPNAYDKERIQECENTFDVLLERLKTAIKYVENEEYIEVQTERS
jgi:hypothetical protein